MILYAILLIALDNFYYMLLFPESKHSTVSSGSSRGTLLPWCAGANRERVALVTPVQTESSAGSDLLPGEFVMRSLFADFAIQADRKMETVMAEPPVRT